MNFKQKKKKLLLNLIKDASELFSTNGCNQINEKYLNIFTEEDLIQLDKEMYESNGDLEEHIGDGFYCDYDWWMIEHLGEELLGDDENV